MCVALLCVVYINIYEIKKKHSTLSLSRVFKFMLKKKIICDYLLCVVYNNIQEK